MPPGLEDMAPDAELLAVLEGLDGARLGSEDTVTVAQAWDRLRNATEAAWLDAMLEIGLLAPSPDDAPRRWPGLPSWGHHEVRAAFVVSADVARRRLVDAQALRIHHPTLRAAMRSGVLDPVRMRIFLRAFDGQRPATCVAVLARVLPEAPSLTPGELDAGVAHVLLELDPDAGEAAYTEAVARRRLVGLRNRNGSVDLIGQNLPVDQATAAIDRVDTIVSAAKNAGHPDPVRTLRPDVACGLLDGRWEGFSDRDVVAALLTGACAAQPPCAEQDDRPEPSAAEPPAAEPPSAEGDGGPGGDGPGGDGPGGDGPGGDGPGGDGPGGDGPGGDGPGGDGPGGDGPGGDGPGGDGPGGDGPGGDGPGGEGPGGEGPGGERPSPWWPRPPAGRARPRRELRIRLSTLLGCDRAPASMAATGIGTHPIPAGVARAMLVDLDAAPHRWRLVLVADDGHLHRAATTRARPRGRPAARGRPPATLVEVQIPLAMLDDLDPDDHPDWAAIVRAARDLAGRPEPPPASRDERRRRHPDAALTDRIRVRDRTCAFPGCRAPALVSETDHTRDWARHGDTVEGNLAATCRADHHLKHLGPWTVRQPTPGVLVWTAPSGRSYTRASTPILRAPAHPLDQPAPHRAATDPGAANVGADHPDADHPEPILEPPPTSRRAERPPSAHSDAPPF